MSALVTLSRAFDERFALASVDGEDGVLLDLLTGEFYRVDCAGVVACVALAEGAGVSGAAAAIVRKFAVTHAQAESDVRALLSSLARPARRRRPKQPVIFRAAENGFAMFVGRRHALDVERATGRVETRRSDPARLRLVAPHVLALQGHAVLHASAALLGRKIVAFMGPSGAGKTTIANMLRSLGAPRVSRDLVVLADTQRAFRYGEASIATWSRRSARVIHASPLEAALRGPAVTVGAILIVERSSAQSALRIDELGGAAAIAALLENAFVELPDPRVWRAALITCGALAARGLVRRAQVPEGRAALRRALSAWVDGGARVTRRT